MRATVVLCDYAQANGGKLTMVGAGWDTLQAPSPMGIGVIFEVEWSETNVPHRIKIDLVDQDGRPVLMSTSEGAQPLRVEAGLEVGRPPGSLHGSPFVTTFAFNATPIAFQHAGRYRWRLFIDEEANNEWQRAFTVATGAVLPLDGAV